MADLAYNAIYVAPCDHSEVVAAFDVQYVQGVATVASPLPRNQLMLALSGLGSRLHGSKRRDATKQRQQRKLLRWPRQE